MPLDKVLFSKDSDEWATPPELLQLCVDVMETISLDPCDSHDHPNPFAKRSFFIDTVPNSLDRVWGPPDQAWTLYLNPPFSNIKRWTEKLVKEYELGHVKEAIALLPARTDTHWFSDIAQETKAFCFLKGRVGYIPPTGTAPAKAPFPSVVLYIGWRKDRFLEVFADKGLCLQHRPPFTSKGQ